MNTITAITLACGLALAAAQQSPSSKSPSSNSTQAQDGGSMQLGTFSVSLAVKDILASKAFYEKLDFKKVGGDIEQKWLILQNGTTTIGLFQGMFKKNMLTFCPGWDHQQKTLAQFEDVRDLQEALKKRDVKIVTEADVSSTGPASFVLMDPDGNPILVDQHVPKPKK